MIRLGNFLFHYRNILFPVFYLLLFLPSPPLFQNFWFGVWIGIPIALAGQILRAMTIGLVYIIRGGKNRTIYADGLVTTGIFAHCRNPLYVGNILVIVGLAFISNSVIYLLIFVPLFLFFYQAIVLAEEHFLQTKFGEAFTRYRHDVNRWLPRWSGLGSTMNSMEFRWQRVAVKEYNSTYIWLTGAVLLVLKHYYTHFSSDVFLQWLPVFILKLAVLLAAYLFVRYMKKSKKWTGD